MQTGKSARRAPDRRPNFWTWAGLALAALVVGFAAVWHQSSTAAAGLPPEVSVAGAIEQREAGAFILDVRTPAEWAEYHVPGSSLIPLDQLAARVDEVPDGQPIVVVCRSGNRSQQGRDILRQAGRVEVTSLAGGLQAWRAAGYPIVTGP